jgi:hypothetical protein
MGILSACGTPDKDIKNPNLNLPQLHQLLSCQKYGPGSALKQTQHCVSILQPHEVDYPFKNNFGIWSVESYEQWAAAYRFHCLKLVDHIAIKCTPQGGAGEVK